MLQLGLGLVASGPFARQSGFDQLSETKSVCLDTYILSKILDEDRKASNVVFLRRIASHQSLDKSL